MFLNQSRGGAQVQRRVVGGGSSYPHIVLTPQLEANSDTTYFLTFLLAAAFFPVLDRGCQS